jgi:hypothetical protein
MPVSVRPKPIGIRGVDGDLHFQTARRPGRRGGHDRGRARLLSDVIHNAEATIQESRALVARARGKPYLASRFGKSIVRDV